MGQMQNKESDGLHTPAQVQKSRQQAQGDALWDDLPAVDRTGAKFQANSPMVSNPNATGTGKQGNPGKPV